MIKEKIVAIAMPREKLWAFAAKFLVLLSLATVAPFFHFQAVTGTIVNATLFIAAVILGRKEAIAIGIFPSLISVITGLLPLAVTPLIPFIIIGNAILILSFSFWKKKNYWAGIIGSSVLKFAFLFLAGKILAELFLGKGFGKIAMTMFSWQQLLTALSGGVVAYAVLKILRFSRKTNQH